MTLGKKQNKKLKAKIKAVKRRVRKSKKVKSLKQKAFGLDQMLFKVFVLGIKLLKRTNTKNFSLKGTKYQGACLKLKV